MDQERKNVIYGRLLAIKVKIEADEIPSPHYINEKIGECHVHIEEVERYSIETSKEISAISQALNNALAEYEHKLGELLQADDIRSLPSIKDRESRANSRLREELGKIKRLQNDQTDLNNLLKAISLKIKNLTRVNADIKMQLRLLEAQIKLGGGPDSNAAMRSLAEEFKKGISNEDAFEDTSAETTIERVEDPSEPLDVDNLLKQNSPDLVEPVPYLPNPEQVGDFIDPLEAYDVPQETIAAAENPADEGTIDLDAAIDFSQEPPVQPEKGGIATEKEEEQSQTQSAKKETVVVSTQKEHPIKKETFDLDALLEGI